MDGRLDEILDRLRDLDRRLSRLEHGDRGERFDRDRDHERDRGGDRDRDRDRGRGRRDDGDEKRVIDTIVRLVCENVAPIVAEVVSRELDRRAPRSDPGERP